MNIQAWPFLVSRNRYLGYQTVVAPSFMAEANMSSLLAHYVGSAPNDSPQYQELPKTKSGHLSVVYWVVTANDQDGVLRDEFGRPILWIEGVVLQDPVENITFSRDVLQEAHNRVVEDYKQFWEQTNDGPVRQSRPFVVTIDSSQHARIASEHSPTSVMQMASTTGVEPEITRVSMRNRSWYAAAVLLVLCIMSILWGVITSVQNRQLASQIHELEETIQALQQTPETSLPSMTVVPTPLHPYTTTESLASDPP